MLKRPNVNKFKILLIGGSGNLGSTILKSRLFKNLQAPSKKKLNLLNKSQIKKYLKKNFNVVINCSGFPRIRKCEKNKLKSYKLNVLTTKNLVKYIKIENKILKKKIKLVQISSDAVYTCLFGNYKESSKYNPKNYYGYCKVKSEKIVRKLSDYLIIRTRFFNKNNFKYNDAAVDIYSSMIEVKQLARIIFFLIKKEVSGIINVGKKRESDFKNIRKFIKKIKKTNRKLIQKKTKLFITKDASLNLKKMFKIFKNHV